MTSITIMGGGDVGESGIRPIRGHGPTLRPTTGATATLPPTVLTRADVDVDALHGRPPVVSARFVWAAMWAFYLAAAVNVLAQ